MAGTVGRGSDTDTPRTGGRFDRGEQAPVLLREGLVDMDVPTRQSYVMAVVRPNERTFASGVTHLVRLGAWAVAPGFAGLLMRGVSLGAPLAVGAGMKIVYDLLLYVAFRNLKPPEEVESGVGKAVGTGREGGTTGRG